MEISDDETTNLYVKPFRRRNVSRAMTAEKSCLVKNSATCSKFLFKRFHFFYIIIFSFPSSENIF